MIFGRSRLELKVGIFVFVGLVILMVFVLLIGNFNSLLLSRPIDLMFSFTNGVKVGAPVRFSGVDVGEVRDLHFDFNQPPDKPNIHMVAWIRNDIKIPRDSTVWINTLGLLGEKYIEIMPGKDYEHCLQPHEALTGVDPMAMHEVVNVIKDTIADLDQTVKLLQNRDGTVGKLLYDDQLYNQLVSVSKELETSIQGISKQFEDMISDIKAHPWRLLSKPKGER